MKITKLLDAISELEIVVPEFQREYVWSLEQAKELMTSLFLDYPTGSLLIWETNQPPEIKNNAVASDRIGWVKVLLDGQQRATTLYLLVKNDIPPYYIADDITNDPRHLYFNLETAEFSYFQKQRMADNPFWKSVTDCFKNDFDAFSLMAALDLETDEKLRIGAIVNSNLNRLRAIADIDYFVQSVPQGVDIDKAIDIFDRVNSQGTKLTEAELALTHIAGRWPQVRRVMKKSIDEYAKHGFEFNLDFITRCLVVVMTNSADWGKLTDEFYRQSTQEDYEAAWNRLAKIFHYLIPILRQSAFIGSTKEMNTSNVLVPIVAYLSKNGGAFVGGQRSQFLYWMFLALIWARYSGQTDQRLDRDVHLATSGPQPVPSLIAEIKDMRGRLEVTPADLEGRGVNHPLYRMLYVLAKHRRAIDWSNGGEIAETMGAYYSIQSHHIYPQAVLYRNGYSSENHLDKQFVNEIANRAFITRDANYSISDKLPAIYLAEVNEKYPSALQQQFIPTDDTLWQPDRYLDFLSYRREAIANAINEFLQELESQNEKAETEEINYDEILSEGENQYVEFKSSLRWDYQQASPSKIPGHSVAKTLAAFMNSQGGKLFIGVDDTGQVLGLEKDFAHVKGNNRDGFGLQLIQVIKQYLGADCTQYITDSPITIAGKDIWIVDVLPSRSPVYLVENNKDEFYIRASASSQPLSLREAQNYIKSRWTD